MSYRGGATFAWQSDYAQFYVVDGGDSQFEAPSDITAEMMVRRWHCTPTGLVVYTNDCLQQLIEVRIFGEEPPADASEWRSGKPWTQVEMARTQFPSCRFGLDSPSKGSPGKYGPNFRVDAVAITVRIQWLEFPGPRYDAGLIEPDVIRLELWPTR
jgi:hypothetical protein